MYTAKRNLADSLGMTLILGDGHHMDVLKMRRDPVQTGLRMR
jgi:hypothetical protein